MMTGILSEIFMNAKSTGLPRFGLYRWYNVYVLRLEYIEGESLTARNLSI